MDKCQTASDQGSLEADTLVRLADAYHAVGDHDAARRSRQQALEIYEDLGHPDLEELRSNLTAGAPETSHTNS